MGISLGGGLSRGQHAAIPHRPLVGLLSVRKAVTETVNNSAVLQDDNELFLPMGANEVWRIIPYVLINSKAASGFRWLFTVPAGATYRGTLTGANAENDFTVVDTTAYAGLGLFVMTNHSLYVGGGLAGNLRLQWAQNVAVAEDTQVLVNSCISAIRVLP